MGLKYKEKTLGGSKIKFYGDKLITLYILSEILKFFGGGHSCPTHQRGSAPVRLWISLEFIRRIEVSRMLVSKSITSSFPTWVPFPTF
jgi:hypothetical protein